MKITIKIKEIFDNQRTINTFRGFFTPNELDLVLSGKKYTKCFKLDYLGYCDLQDLDALRNKTYHGFHLLIDHLKMEGKTDDNFECEWSVVFEDEDNETINAKIKELEFIENAYKWRDEQDEETQEKIIAMSNYEARNE